MSLKRQAISGLAYTFAEKFSIQGINFVVSVILARLLMPSEFGLIGMMSIFIAVGNVLIDGGMATSVVRTKDPDQGDFTVAFYYNIATAVVMYFIVFVSAPWIARFFEQESLTAIARTYCLIFLIRAPIAVQTARLSKKMNFKAQMFVTIPSVFVGGIVGVVLAWKGMGVWSLVWMSISQYTVSSSLYWYNGKWMPSLSVDRSKLRHHFDFGYKITVSNLLTAVFENVNNIIIGKYFSASQLGFFIRANSLKQLPVDNLAAALQRVTFPLFASIQDDNIRLKTSYKKLMQQVLFWIAPLLCGMGILAEPIFLVLFTEKWLPAVPYFQILCITGIMYPLHLYNLSILNVKGRSDLFLRIEIFKKVYTVVGILSVVPFGIYGLLYFHAFSTIALFFVNTYYSGRLIDYPVKEQVADIVPIFRNTILMGIVVFVFVYFFPHSVPWYDFVIIASAGMIGAVVYGALGHFTRLEPFEDFKLIVRRR